VSYQPGTPWWVVVLSWNGRDDTLACLRSVAAIPRKDVGVVCVDNGSSDGSVQAVMREFPQVDVIENGRNLGFAGGNNVGIVHALERGARWIVLVNNDAVIDLDAIDAFEAAAAAHPKAGILGGKLLFRDRPDHIWFAGQRFNSLLGYSGRPRGYGRPDGPRYAQIVSTDRAVGALLAVSRRAVDAVGLLDEELFAYVEDVDWAIRVRRAGLQVLLAPAARAWHAVSAASGGEAGSTHTLYYGARNTIVVTERHRSLGRIGTRLRRFAILSTFSAHALTRSDRRAAMRAVRDGYRDALAGRLGMRP
jgi:GT2 family glycosyltransferase